MVIWALITPSFFKKGHHYSRPPSRWNKSRGINKCKRGSKEGCPPINTFLKTFRWPGTLSFLNWSIWDFILLGHSGRLSKLADKTGEEGVSVNYSKMLIMTNNACFHMPNITLTKMPEYKQSKSNLPANLQRYPSGGNKVSKTNMAVLNSHLSALFYILTLDILLPLISSMSQSLW